MLAVMIRSPSVIGGPSVLSVLFILMVVGITAVVVTCLVAVAVFRGFGRLINGRPAGPGTAPVGFDSTRRCRNPGCRAGNPPFARFCRRCGANIGDVTVGMWRSPADRARLTEVA